MSFTLIAAVGKNGELGLNGGLPWPELTFDQAYFKQVTGGHIVVMGRKTFDSLGRKPLAQRQNIVLKTEYWKRDDYEFNPYLSFRDVEGIIGAFKDYEEEVFIIGGASIYKQFMDVADKILLTEISSNFEADTYFPQFDKSRYKKKRIGNPVTEHGLIYQFTEYTRIHD